MNCKSKVYPHTYYEVIVKKNTFTLGLQALHQRQHWSDIQPVLLDFSLCSTCFLPLVAAAPSVCFIDARMIAAHDVCVVTAGFPQGRQPVIQFIYTLQHDKDMTEKQHTSPSKCCVYCSTVNQLKWNSKSIYYCFFSILLNFSVLVICLQNVRSKLFDTCWSMFSSLQLTC